MARDGYETVKVLSKMAKINMNSTKPESYLTVRRKVEFVLVQVILGKIEHLDNPINLLREVNLCANIANNNTKDCPAGGLSRKLQDHYPQFFKQNSGRFKAHFISFPINCNLYAITFGQF